MTDYQFNVFYSDEDRCYVADIAALKFCSTLGPTLSQPSVATRRRAFQRKRRYSLERVLKSSRVFFSAVRLVPTR